MATLTVTVKQKALPTGVGYEGSFRLPSATAAKLARKDGKTVFPNRGSLSQAANRFVKLIGWSDAVLIGPTQKTPAKS